uniref:DNA-processing protein DprA n=1 Tax=Roseihalotalea indica TaxID=2867963 RepID=A0AA49JJC4_9BACT|nr:DNA-processing protein DprA [Tunicatimonas sp. TK19036]
MISQANDTDIHSYDAAVYHIALSMTPMIGGSLARQLINYCGSAEAVFRSRPSQLGKIPGIGPKILASLRSHHHLLDKAQQEIERCIRQGITVLTYQHPQYPERLRHIYDVPLVLYYQGNADLNHQRIISIVGTRQATSYGLEILEEITATLAQYDVLIASGLAYGIDIHAHRLALQHNIPTVAVMANGLDQIYPAVHRKDAWAFAKQGGLLTENPLGTKPEARKFPARNRIIAGLADAVIVIEAATKGGALITADLANDYDREVFAVPGNVGQKYSQGCNQLIQQHKAHLINTGEDVIKMLNWDLDNATKASSPKRERQIPVDLSENEQKVYEVLVQHQDGLLLDKISWLTQLPVSELAAVLLSLEFKHYVRVRPGNKYQLRAV